MAKTGKPWFEIEQSRQLLLGEAVARNARNCPDVEGVIFKDKRLRYLELDQRVNCLANALLSAGIKIGDSIGLVMPNRSEMLEIFFAAAKIGAVNVPVNTRLSAPEMSYILNNAEAKIVFFSGNFSGTMTNIRDELPLVKEYIVLDEKETGPFQFYEDLLASGNSVRPEILLKDDQEVFIIYTAGTTGRPKGAILTHKNVVGNAMGIGMDAALSLPRRGDLPFISPRVMSITPFFHIAGAVGIVKNIVSVTPMIVMDFDPLELLKVIEAERVTYMFLVPVMWKMVMDHPDFNKYDVSSLRTAGYGADVTPNALKERILESFPNAALYEAFGQTEMSATAVMMKHQDAMRKEGSVGLPLTTVDVRVVDDHMQDVGVDEVGEIVYRGPGMFKGYYKNPEETEKSFEGGWFHSGDLVRRDAEGFIYIVDRKKDMIISGGENIYSAEVEAVLITHPKIREAAVIGVADPKWGEAVKAFVGLEPGQSANAEEVIAFCGEHLARFKLPKTVEFVSSLPRSATGKILKRELRVSK